MKILLPLPPESADPNDHVMHCRCERTLPDEPLELAVWSLSGRKRQPFDFNGEGLLTSVNCYQVEVVSSPERVHDRPFLAGFPTVRTTLDPVRRIGSTCITTTPALLFSLLWMHKNADLRVLLRQFPGRFYDVFSLELPLVPQVNPRSLLLKLPDKCCGKAMDVHL
jgi:hypothetical protein